MTRSRRSGRSNTCRFSTPIAAPASRGKPQWPHAHAACPTTQSGSAACRNVPPLCPVCPPLVLPERPRRLPPIRGFFRNPSLEGGCELFELSRPNCRRRSATSARSAAISALRDAINSSTSAGRTIPPLIHSLDPPSPRIRISKPLSQTLWHSGLTTPWELPGRLSGNVTKTPTAITAGPVQSTRLRP